MMMGSERILAQDEIIVSKTDTKGRILYANRTFLSIADYEERELLDKPHNIIRHPDMPRTIFKVLWDHIRDGKEVFSYIKNSAKNGDYYWVFAHVTPTFGEAGRVVGYHSNRRAPERAAITDMTRLYRELCTVEAAQGGRKEGLAAGEGLLNDKLKAAGMTLDEFVFSYASDERAVG
ncbi:transcriptional regulator [Iodidimonas muriae]|uniref:Transcriptional regulator n=1 Tax=Iodidimonas muriae TaxID=261467 RepID=A0ABQ2LGZ6_9PROT|nr:PAS domain-containing protein [Iodidimonas muriae]GER07628.1 transcriptional regulator [Kordiimonadales bacterium JCM 17843]GGO14459.1 transcriptional regulator [Iodidimonas muriae]